MKTTAKQYAQSLYEIISTTEVDLKVVIENFVNILIKNNQINKVDQIILEFTKIWNKEEGIAEGELISARELDNEVIELLNNQIAELLKVKKVNLKTTVDKNILGGFVAKLDDTVINGSVKNQLQNLKYKLSN